MKNGIEQNLKSFRPDVFGGAGTGAEARVKPLAEPALE